MGFRFKAVLSGSLVTWFAAVALSSGAAQAAPQTTTNDGVYTKAQADGAKAQFEKLCASCHAFTVAEKKKPKDLPLGDEPFFESWTGRPLSAMISVIALTMPNDGSAVVTDQEAIDLVAYILQQNGFPAGEKALTKETAAAVVERPKK
jgi:mono/diheme cytochrome c family protein